MLEENLNEEYSDEILSPAPKNIKRKWDRSSQHFLFCDNFETSYLASCFSIYFVHIRSEPIQKTAALSFVCSL